MEIIIRATPEEAAALANLLQGRQTSITEQVAQKRGENVKEIKRRREARGMKQVELADALGVSQPTIVTWESAEGYPPSRFLPALAAVLGCTIDELYADEPPQTAV